MKKIFMFVLLSMVHGSIFPVGFCFDMVVHPEQYCEAIVARSEKAQEELQRALNKGDEEEIRLAKKELETAQKTVRAFQERLPTSTKKRKREEPSDTHTSALTNIVE